MVSLEESLECRLELGVFGMKLKDCTIILKMSASKVKDLI
jgi:hypothetical protein